VHRRGPEEVLTDEQPREKSDEREAERGDDSSRPTVHHRKRMGTELINP